MSKSGGLGLAHNVLEMPCLGRPFQLGTLYDCRNDSLIPGVTLWGPETLRTALDTNMEGSDFEVITSDSLGEKTFHLDVSAGLKLSVLGGLVKAEGSGKFLYDRTTSKNQARVSLRYKATSRFEQLNMSHLSKFEYQQAFEHDIATHVVTGVQYGADAIFVFDRQVESSEMLTQVHGNLEAMISALPGIDLKVGGSTGLDFQKKGNEGMEEIHCKFYGDFILPKNPTTYQDAVRVYQELPKLLGGVGYPKSVAKKVWLYPLSRLDSNVDRLVREISSWLVDDVQELLESLHDLEIRTNDLIRSEVYNYFIESKGDLEKLKKLIDSYKRTLLRDLSTLLPQVRGGGADENKLAELLEKNSMSPFSCEQLSSWIRGKEMEASTLAMYLKELKDQQIQFAFSPAEMVVITKKLDKETILCFDFNIPAGNDICLQKMKAYLHEQAVSQELQVQNVWYKTLEMRQALQRFVNFVKTNTGREGVKYVVTNGSAGDIIESVDKVGVMFMYEDACPTMFEPPDQPGKPQALSVTHNSIQLKWAKPKYGATSVQSYTAAYRSSDDPTDQWCTQASDEECLELTNLTPGSLYYIKVTAETSVGSSPTSEVSEAIQLPPDQPSKPHASEKNYNCVQLKWSKPKHGADIVQYYTVLYQSTEGQWCKKTSEEEFLLLINLTPGSLYSLKVIAESSAGCSLSSEAIEVQLPPDQPGKPFVTEVTHNSAQLKWDKPKHGSKIVECYEFFHRLADNPPREWLIQEIDKECLYLKKLTPGSLYYFKVTAESSAGSSPESVVSEVWLPPDQPGNPEIKSTTHNSLQLKWSKPKHGADIVQSYTLSYCCVDDPPYQWSTQTCSEEYSMLTKLIPGSVYRFKVFTNSRAGPGPASEVSEVMLPPDKPGKPHVSGVTHNSLQLTWAKPKHGAGIVQSYTVTYHSVDSPNNQWCTHTSNEECLVLTKLTPGLLYHIKATANSSAGTSPVSEMSEVRLPSGQPGKPHASGITHSSIQLEWSRPKHGAEIVQYYTLLYQSTEGQWCKKEVDEEFFVLANLTPGSLYRFKVVAESSAGSSLSSEVSEVQIPPDQPGRPFATEVTHNSVQLKWEKPKHGSRIVEGYKIFYCYADNSAQEWLTQQSKKEYHMLTKLTPGTVYYFKVTAESCAGSSPESAVNEMLLPPDQPGKPESLVITHNSIQLKWSRPKHGADIIKSYAVSYSSVDIPQDQWCTQTSNKEYLVLTKLIPGSLYHIKVTANSPAGPSPASEVSEVWLPPDQPGKPHASNATYNSVRLKWTKPKHGAETVQLYSISCQAVDNQCYNVSTTSKHEYVTVTKLTPKTVYTFKVIAMSAAGHGLESELSDPVETALPPPGKPHASNVTYNSLQLNWEKPSHGAGSVQFYTVSYCSGNHSQDQWNTKRTPVAVESIQFINLFPKTVYFFKVRADSAAGPSPDSELSDSIETNLLPISEPGKPTATRVTHNSVTLLWDKPEQSADFVKCYKIFYRRSVDDPADSSWHAHKTQGPLATAQLSDLVPQTSYVFKIRAESTAGASQDSEISDLIETLSPVSEPGKPAATIVTCNSITLKWDKPERGADIVEHYTIFYRRSVDDPVDSSWHAQKTSEPLATAQLSDLVPQTAYTFKVQAESTAGASPDSEISDSIETLLPISQPGKPRDTKVTHDSITLKWDKPERGAEIVKQYTIFYRRSIDDPDAYSSWHTYYKATKPLETARISNLFSQTAYVFKVQAEATAGSSQDSELSDPIETLSSISQPGKPYAFNVTDNSITLHWRKPHRGTSIVQYYTIFYQRSANDTGNWTALKTYNAQQKGTLFNLDPKTSYVFKLRAESATGPSPESELSDPIETLLPISQPGKPIATDVTHNCITLQWCKPEHGSHNVRCYTIFYRDTRSSIDHHIKINASSSRAQEEVIVSDLAPNTEYTFKVRAESNRGVSPDSELSEPFRTLVPVSEPGKPFATKVTHDSVTLKWERPVQGAQHLKHYKVIYYPTDDSENTTSCTAKAEKITLSKLDPQNTYIFKVQAETVAGSITESELSDPIKTLLSPPGKPYASHITYNGFHVNWQRSHYRPILYYSVSYQATNDPPDMWHTKKTTGDITNFSFSAAQGIFYVFKVAAVTSAGVSSDSELSDPIETLAEPWDVKIYRSLSPIPNSNPPTYLLPTHCVMKKKDTIVKVHVGADSHGKINSGVHTGCSCHTRTAGVPHKVLMLVGATGAGKTTLINGMANYILGVQWDDDLRYKLIADSTSQDQSKSQTTCITAYTFYKEKGSHLPYTLTVINIPGFGDTGGLERDKQIVGQIKELFPIAGKEEIDVLHGIGFVTQAPIAQLTPTQRYVFDAILSVFGKDVANNIFLMITFADGMKPPVLDAVKDAGVPNKAFFKFNNSALFASKSADDEFDRMFWKMGTKSFDEFFKQFSSAKAQSLQLSREVIQERETLEVTIQGLQPQIQLGLSKIVELRQERQMLEDHEADILTNQGFTYRVEVTKQRKIDLPTGTYTTNCLTCNYTCHESCAYADDGEKYKCSAMRSGRGTLNAECGVCPQKCSWKVHMNNPYRFELYQDYVTKTSDELKTRYESAMSSKEQLECVIKKMKKELDTMNMAVLRKMEQARRSVQRLQEIALKPNYLTEVEYIDLIIETEKREHKPRWMDRVKALEGVRQQAEIETKLMKNPRSQQQYVYSIEEIPQEKSQWQKFLHKLGVN